MKDKLEHWVRGANWEWCDDNTLPKDDPCLDPACADMAIAIHVARKVLQEVEDQGHIDKAKGYIHIPLVYWEDLIQSLDSEEEK